MTGKTFIIRLSLLVFLVPGIFLLPPAARAQKNIATHYNGWYMYFGNHRISEKFGIHTEYQWRRNEWIAHWQQSLMRVGIDWHVTPSVMLTGGYGWIHSFPYGDQPISFSFHEHRAWQQLVLQHSTGRFYFHHRYRTEQRILENIAANPQGEPQRTGYFYRNRARYRLQVSIPLTKKEMTGKTLFASVYNEVFLGFGKGIRKNILDQNRLFIALGWRFNPNCNIQLGYLNHYVIKPDGIHHERNHTLQAALTYNLDFRK